MRRCRITVLRRTLNQEYIDAYRTDEVLPCEFFREGQTFTVDSPFDLPEGFCPWAWGDIRYNILATMLGGERPWANPPDMAISCCTDGYRPVFFKIEVIHE